MVGGLLLAFGFPGLLWPFTSMHQREVLAAGGGNFADTPHIILAAVTLLFMLPAIGVRSTAFGKRFRLYSIATFLILLLFDELTALDSPKVSANLPTPGTG